MSGGFLTRWQTLADPVHCRWWWGRLRNRWPATPEAPRPAYRAAIPRAEAVGQIAIGDLSPMVAAPGLLTLPGGETLRIVAGKDPIDRQWDDPATAAAFQSFAWTPQDPDGAALAILWPAWLGRHAEAEPSDPAWDPDIVAERAVALLDMARRRGLPKPRAATIRVLAAHAARLLGGFADDDAPSMALARRAHALIRLGLDLAMPATAGFGMTAMLAECDALLLPSGVSALESTHLHLVLCQSLADAWLAARRHERSETGALERLLRRALAVVPQLTLSGGLPQIGDVAESLPVGWLDGLLRGAPIDQGWTGQLADGERARLLEVREASLLVDLEALRADGWLRVDLGGWNGLWHAAPGGWPAFDGYGHQDLGSCELHYDGVPIFVDPGGSRLGNINGQAFCRSAAKHSGLQLNGRDPYPLNHPDYSDAFRRQIGGTPPWLRAEFDGACLIFGGLAGIGGLREGSRRWRFDEGAITIDDRLNGTGRILVSRRLLTPLGVRREDSQTVVLEGSDRRFRLIADRPLVIDKGVRWRGFGTTEPLSIIEINGRCTLPWRGSIRVFPA